MLFRTIGLRNIVLRSLVKKNRNNMVSYTKLFKPLYPLDMLLSLYLFSFCVGNEYNVAHSKRVILQEFNLLKSKKEIKFGSNILSDAYLEKTDKRRDILWCFRKGILSYIITQSTRGLLKNETIKYF